MQVRCQFGISLFLTAFFRLAAYRFLLFPHGIQTDFPMFSLSQHDAGKHPRFFPQPAAAGMP